MSPVASTALRQARFALQVSALTLALLITSTLAVSAETKGPGHFRRGASVYSLLGWGDLKPGDTSHYRPAPFATSLDSAPDALLRNAAKAGFDFIRLSVDPGPFIQLTGAPRDQLDRLLLRDVHRLRSFGFAAIVDIHPNAQVPAYNSYGYTDAVDSPGFRAYAALLRRTARLLQGLDDPEVALELMNEPPNNPDPESTALWQTMLERFHAAARAEAPRLLLVLSGAQADLPAVDTAQFKSSNVLYTFHYYEPHDFTHQGVPAGDGEDDYRRYLAGLPYPARLVRNETDLVIGNVASNPGLDPATRTRILAEALEKVAAYRASGFDRKTIRGYFQTIAGWAARNGIPADHIILGEFGVARRFENQDCADPASAEAWTRDVREEAESHGFGWAVWALTGGSFMRVAVAEGSTTLDRGTLAALGLRDPAPSR